MAKPAKSASNVQGAAVPNWSEIAQGDTRIKELRAVLNEADALISEERERVGTSMMSRRRSHRPRN